MALKPEYSVMAGVTVGAVVFGIHTAFLPTQADIQALPAGTPDIDAAERKATWLSAAVVGAVSLMAGDPTIFVIGSGITVAMALITRHNNHSESIGGKYLTPAERMTAGTSNTGPDPVATAPYEMFQGASDFDR
jgi:hypothetical protein